MLGGLGDQAVAQLVVGEHALDHPAQRPGVLGREPQPDALVGHDLPQTAGVGDDARAARRHRLQRDEAERLVDRRHHRQVGDPVERVQDVVADPPHERAVAGQAEAARLVLELPLVRA